MIIHVQLKTPVGSMLGFSQDHGYATLEMPVNSGTSLWGLFEQLALKYPGCQPLVDPKNNILNDLLIIKDGTVVVSNDLDQIALQEQSTITLFTQYKGG